MASSSKSQIWDKFKKTKDGSSAVCNSCAKVIKCSGGSTTGMHNHLKLVHNMNMLKRNEINERDDNPHVESKKNSQLQSQPSISKFFNLIDESLPAVLSRLVARDCISFYKISASYDIQNMLKAKHSTNVPKSPHTIKKIVMQYGDKIKNECKRELKVKIGNEEVFGLKLDEWTSLKNRRFMNVNIHSSDNHFWNLGLRRMTGSMPAINCGALLENKLNEFCILLKYIFSITTDAASVMKKMGLLLDVNHQLCFAHGIQLAILDVIYKKRIEAESFSEFLKILLYNL